MGRSLLRNLPIRTRLRAIILITSGAALLAAFGTFLTYQWLSSRAAQVRRLQMTAEILADQEIAALQFGHRRQAEAILFTLQAQGGIVGAAVYDQDGRMFARYLREGQDPGALPARPGPAGCSLERGEFEVVHPMEAGGERVGTLYLRSDRREARRDLRVNLAVAGAALAVAVPAVLLLSRRLGRHVTEPIVHLADVVRRVSKRRDYSLRAVPGGRDELSQLMRGFNAMLSTIQDRDQALARARDELEARVRERTSELESANRELEGFSYSVSHDLRAPLRAIHGYSRILAEDVGSRLDPGALRHLALIGDNTRRMGRLIDDLLTFSRMGRVPLERAEVDMCRMAEEVFAELAAEHPGRRFEFRRGEPPPAVGDPAMLRQVWANLLSNAVKYTRERDPARIEAGGRVEGRENLYWVKDNGVGFDMRYAGKLFGVFQRLHSSRDYEGTGVGLALVQRIVQRHGGRIWAEGALGAGAAFYFSLPAPGGGDGA